MTKSEYQDLVEFIAPQFDRIGKRFDAMDERFDAMDERFDAIGERFDAMDERFDAMDERFDAMDERVGAMDDRLRRVEILEEDNRHRIQIVTEAVSGNKRALGAVRSEMAVGFQDLRELLQASYMELDRRVTRLEEGLSS